MHPGFRLTEYGEVRIETTTKWGDPTVETRSLIGLNLSLSGRHVRLFVLRLGSILFKIPEKDLTTETLY